MRSLSNPEYNQFTQDEASVIQSLGPGQSKIVSWNGMSILVYIGPNYVDVNGDLYPDVYTSDVSDAPQLQAMLQPGFSAPPQTMLDTLPAAIEQVIAGDAATAGALLNSSGQLAVQLITGVAGAAGAAAGAATAPLLSNLTVPIVAAAVILLLIYKKS